HSPMDGGASSLPEPDVAVVRGRPRDFLHAMPGRDDVLLVVEVAVTSLRVDRAKAAIYASAGVPVYWLVDVQSRRVEVYSAPDGAHYGLVEVLNDGDALPVPVVGGTLPIAQLLP